MAGHSIGPSIGEHFAVSFKIGSCVLAAALVCTPVAFGQIAFAPPVDYSVGGPSTVMAAADFNGDGYPDLAVEANYSSSGDSIVVLMNNGDGTFGAPVTYSLPNGYVGKILAVDLNGDGLVDLVAGGVSSTGPGFYVLINNGFGTFQSPVFYTDPYGGPNIFTVDWSVGDFFTNERIAIADHQVTLFGVLVGTNLWANDGTGKFTFASKISDGMAPGFTIGDANGDGILDFIGGSPNNCNGAPCLAAETLGTGNGVFPTYSTYSANGGVFAVADISSPSTGRPDGFPDVLATSGAPQISVLVNSADGTGSFAQAITYSIQWLGSWLTMADFDGDGVPDIAGAGADNSGNWVVEIVKTVSGGGFTNAGEFLVAPHGISCSSGAFRAVDLNGDGLPVLISSGCGSNIQVLLNQSAPLGNGSPVQLSPPSLTFPALTITKTSIARTVTLNYVSGTGLLNISNVSISGDFALAGNSCVAKLTAGGSCTYSITFTPTATGTRFGTLTVTDNQSGSPHILNLIGTGKDPAITFSPAKLMYAGQLLGVTSASKTARITNSGIGDLVISSVSPSGNFTTLSDSCTGVTVAQGQNCTVGVTFTPSIAGSVTGELTITDDARTSPQVLSLSGSGLNPLSVSPMSLAFGTVAVGSISPAKTVTVTNNSPNIIGINFPASGDYSATGGGSTPCGNSLPANSKCNIAVTFAPTQNNSISGGLLIYTTSEYSQTLPVSLSGSGTGAGVVPLKFSPPSLTFANQVIFTASAPQTVTVTNASLGTVNISSFSATAPEFSSSGSGANPCGGALLKHRTCTLTVTFGSPEAPGTIKGSVVFVTDNAVSPQIYGLSGIGILPVTIAPASLTFPPQTVGTVSAPQTMTLTNNQSATTLNLANIVATGQYTAAPGGTAPCASTLAPLTQCTEVVTFSPAATGAISGVVTVTHDAKGSPQEIKLTGTGQ
jgi:hypothetical protein